jgi:VWFA-related protein
MRLLAAATFWLLAAAGMLRAQETQEPLTYSSEVELVTVDAVVLDSEGQPVRGLTREDFSVLEDGKLQEIASFEALDLGPEAGLAARPPGPIASNEPSSPRSVAATFFVLVDDLGLAPTRIEFLREALARLLDEGLRDGDEVILATTSGETWWATRLPEGREDLRALVGGIRGRRLTEQAPDWMSDWEAHQIDTYADQRAPTGTSGGPTVPPSTGGAPTPPAGLVGIPEASPALMVTDIAGRVTRRWLERGVCDERNLGMCESLVRARAGEQNLAHRRRTRATVEAIEGAIGSLALVRGRKSLLLFSQGFLNDHELPEVRRAAGRSLEANVAVYFLSVRGLEALTGGMDASAGLRVAPEPGGSPRSMDTVVMESSEQLTLEMAGSEGLAEDTGGFVVKNTNDLAGGALRVAEESRVYYLLGYAPPTGKGPRDWRKLRVEVRRPGLKVRARRGYTLRDPTQRQPESPEGEDAPPSPEVERALVNAHDLEGIGLRATTLMLEPRSEETIGVTLGLGLDASRLAFVEAGEGRVATISLDVRVARLDGGPPQHLRERLALPAGQGQPGWAVLTRSFALPEGVAQARVVVRDEASARLGALTTRFEVPPAEGLRLSTPILTDRVTPPRDGTPSQPVLVLRREFGPTQRLYCQFQVYGAQIFAGIASVEARHELRLADGTVVRRGSPSVLVPAMDGHLVRMIGLHTADLPPGDYELAIYARDVTSEETAETVVSFRIAGG